MAYSLYYIIHALFACTTFNINFSIKLSSSKHQNFSTKKLSLRICTCPVILIIFRNGQCLAQSALWLLCVYDELQLTHVPPLFFGYSNQQSTLCSELSYPPLSFVKWTMPVHKSFCSVYLSLFAEYVK